MQLDRIDLADIHAPRRLARAVHDQLGPLPGAVPVVEIARALDIGDVRLDVFDGFEGMLLTDRRRSTGAILANTRLGSRRARFTVAHELGHFLLERHVLSDEAGFRCRTRDLRETGDSTPLLRQETEANQFAIDLLAPPALVKPFLAGEPDLAAARSMARALDISFEAAVRRYLDLSPEPLAAIWSKDGCVRYWSKTRAFPFVTCRKGDRLPQTTAAFPAVASATRGFTAMTDTHALAWTDYPDIDMREQTRVARNGHAVTLLWANLPDDDDEEDDVYPELGPPRFR